MDDETREFLRSLIDTSDAPPPDVVPYPPPTREERRRHLLTLNDTAGTWAEVTAPGEVILDVDGMPVGVTEATTSVVYRGGAAVTTRDLEDAGLTPADVPRLHVTEPPTNHKSKESNV